MRIGINAILASKNLRGVGRYLQGLLHQYGCLSPDDQFIVFIPPWLQGEFPAHPNLSYVVLRTPQRRALRNLWQLLVFPFLLPKYHLDCLHIPDTSPLVFKTVKTVVTIHDLAEYQQPEKYGWFQSFARRWIVGLECLVADHVITISNASMRSIERFLKVDAKKITVIPHRVPQAFSRQSAGRSEVRHKYGLPERYLLYVGEIERTKNVETLLQAYNLLPAEFQATVKVVLAGRAGNAKASIQSYLDALGERIIMLGFVPDDDLVALYHSALAFVFPSLMEGFGYPVIEAMACGTPVLSSNATSLPEVCGDAALYFDPNNPSELADHIITIVSNEPLRAALSIKGEQRVKHFSARTDASETLGVYHALANR